MNITMKQVDLPDFGLPDALPEIPKATYEARIEAANQKATEAGYDTLLIYADREHCANMVYLTGFDPRFEEALLILKSGQEPVLLLGNECLGYSEISPVSMKRVLFQAFSLPSQPRSDSDSLVSILNDAGINDQSNIGTIGWKYFTEEDTPNPKQRIEIPTYIVDTLREIGCDIANANDLFMHPVYGLRTINEVDQLAFFEHSTTWASHGVWNMLSNVKVGMTEFECVQNMGYIGLPTAYHYIMLAGERTKYGLASPSGYTLQLGDPIFAAFGYWGSNSVRGGFLVEDASQLPTHIQDYVEKLVIPFYRAVASWYETIGIGVEGKQLYDVVHQHVGDPFFNVFLNPGHLIHIEEWTSSPVYKNSTDTLKSGMAFQMDIIPGTGTDYYTSNAEDGLALADEALREEFAVKYPGAWGRIQARREFVQSALSIRLKPEVLLFSNIPIYLPPFWLSANNVMVKQS